MKSGDCFSEFDSASFSHLSIFNTKYSSNHPILEDLIVGWLLCVNNRFIEWCFFGLISDIIYLLHWCRVFICSIGNCFSWPHFAYEWFTVKIMVLNTECRVFDLILRYCVAHLEMCLLACMYPRAFSVSDKCIGKNSSWARYRSSVRVQICCNGWRSLNEACIAPFSSYIKNA